MKSFFDKLSRKSGTGKEKQTKEGPALVPKAVGGGTRRRNATTRRSSSHFLSSMLIKAASSMLDHSSPGLRNVLALSSSLLKKSKLLKIPLMSLLAECSYTSLLSFAVTLVLILLTLRYLHFLHAKSDMTRRRDLRMFQSELRETLAKLNCGPIMLRLAWSDCATFDKSIKQWPQCGGATATIRFEREFKCTANAGLSKALDILQGIRKRYKTVSWADAIQMAGALAVEIAGGPSIPMRYGRIDAPDLATSSAAAPTVAGCPLILSTRLPSALPPFPDNAPSADVHIRNCFYRMGFSNRDIVALCGAHTLGRAFKDRSGACPFTSGDQGATSFTRPTSDAKGDGSHGIGMAGGCSWTRHWLKFDNSYFNRSDLDDELLWLPTDKALKECPEFRHYFSKYSTDETAFFADYASAHKKMSENGARFSPPSGLSSV